MARAVLSLKDVGLIYRRRMSLWNRSDHRVFSGITFDVEDGETLGIIGRNGAGKSSLLRILAGILRPTEGKLMDFGATVSMLSLSMGLDPQLSGKDNAILSGLLLGFNRAQARENLERIRQFSELGEAFEEPVKTYSAGMKTRLGFAIAIHLKPDVLLIDEVLGVGDLEFRKKSSNYLRSKIRSNQTVVLVSHDPSVVRELCDRVVWIEQGRCTAIGEPASILRSYQSALLDNGFSSSKC